MILLKGGKVKELSSDISFTVFFLREKGKSKSEKIHEGI